MADTKEYFYKNEYIVLLGKLKSNLISLETILRFCILKKEGDEKNFISPFKTEIGDIIKIDAFTNYDDLGKLIDKYNDYQLENEKIDKDKIVSIRDLFAHGRAFSSTEESPLVIVKYSKPNNGFVKMTHKEVLGVKWFNDAIMTIHDLAEKIAKKNKLTRNF